MTADSDSLRKCKIDNLKYIFFARTLHWNRIALFFWQQRRKGKKMQLKAMILKLQKNYAHIQNILRLMLGPTIWDIWDTTEKLFLVEIFEFCLFVRSTISDTVEFLLMEIFKFCCFVINTFTWYCDLHF